MLRRTRFVLLAFLYVSMAAQAYGRADLFQAVRSDDLSVLRTAVAEKANLESRGPRDVTLLMHAAAFGSLESVKILLDAGVDPNAKDGFGANALVWAAGDAANGSVARQRRWKYAQRVPAACRPRRKAASQALSHPDNQERGLTRLCELLMTASPTRRIVPDSDWRS